MNISTVNYSHEDNKSVIWLYISNELHCKARVYVLVTWLGLAGEDVFTKVWYNELVDIFGIDSLA